MVVPWVETCRLRGGNIIIRSPFYVTGERNLSGSFYHKLAEKGLPKKKKLLGFAWVRRCTGDQIIALKHVKVRFSWYVAFNSLIISMYLVLSVHLTFFQHCGLCPILRWAKWAYSTPEREKHKFQQTMKHKRIERTRFTIKPILKEQKQWLLTNENALTQLCKSLCSEAFSVQDKEH